jgi:hypothetical protein
MHYVERQCPYVTPDEEGDGFCCCQLDEGHEGNHESSIWGSSFEEWWFTRDEWKIIERYLNARKNFQ